jgi:hypothetical protein
MSIAYITSTRSNPAALGETTMDTNIHPADELAAIREEIKILEEREKVLRDALVNGSDEDRDGRQYRAFIQSSVRESIDKPAIIAALGADVVAPFLKKADVKSLKLAKKQEASPQ